MVEVVVVVVVVVGGGGGGRGGGGVVVIVISRGFRLQGWFGRSASGCAAWNN